MQKATTSLGGRCGKDHENRAICLKISQHCFADSALFFSCSSCRAAEAGVADWEWEILALCWVGASASQLLFCYVFVVLCGSSFWRVSSHLFPREKGCGEPWFPESWLVLAPCQAAPPQPVEARMQPEFASNAARSQIRTGPPHSRRAARAPARLESCAKASTQHAGRW